MFVLLFNIQSKIKLKKHIENGFPEKIFSDKKGLKIALFEGMSALFKVIFQKEVRTISR